MKKIDSHIACKRHIEMKDEDDLFSRVWIFIYGDISKYRSKYDDIYSFNNNLNVISWTLSIMYASWFEQEWCTLEECLKFDAINK